MKNISKAICKITAAALLMTALIITGGCADSESAPSPETTAPTAASQNVAQGEFDIKALQYYDAESTDKFSGAWKITDGVGSGYSSFVYIFDGNGKASLVIGNMGYLSTYSLENDEDTGIPVFVCQLMFGINGEYAYEFSESGDSVVLTYVDGGETTTLEKLEDYTFVPTPDSNPDTDSALLGAWASDSGVYQYFGADGIMYTNTYGAMFTYYKYSAKDGAVTAVYDMNGEITENYEYSFDGDKLTFDNTEYTKIPESDLM